MAVVALRNDLSLGGTMICTTPIGPLVLRAANGALTGCDFLGGHGPEDRYSDQPPLIEGLDFLQTPLYGGATEPHHSTLENLPADLPRRAQDATPESIATLERAAAQLEEYFLGTRTEFDLPLAPEGTEFQKRVWQELQRIPHGRTISYGTLAERLAQPGASRAVGAANGRNPISIIIPCHRVIGSAGQLAGYSSGVERKKWLLNYESQTKR